jgi:hypothetical protein
VSDRAVRNLLALQDTASTSRVLNLVSIWNHNRSDIEYSAKPLFNNAILNKSIIIKHKLRSHELDLFGDDRSTGTKILIPIDSKELKLGGRYVFINQKNFDSIAQTTFGSSFFSDKRDRSVLDLLDATPSLDPFLLREQLKRFGIFPADCYFEISKADIDRMHAFVTREINMLVSKSFGNDNGNLVKSSKLVSKILSSTADEDLDPLRLNLRMQVSEFSEGLFCWRGFLYYKWSHVSSIPKVNSTMKQMIKYHPVGPMDNETRDSLIKVRASLARNIIRTIGEIEATLKRYDEAYAGLTSNNEPQAFRQFLLTAPSLFKELGERLGVVSHIISYWGFRFPSGKEPPISATELLRVFSDFDENLSFHGTSTAMTW